MPCRQRRTGESNPRLFVSSRLLLSRWGESYRAARSDAVRLGRQHIRDGLLSLRQDKTANDVRISVVYTCRGAAVFSLYFQRRPGPTHGRMARAPRDGALGRVVLNRANKIGPFVLLSTPFDPLPGQGVRLLVHSGTIRLDSASSNRNSARFAATGESPTHGTSIPNGTLSKMRGRLRFFAPPACA